MVELDESTTTVELPPELVTSVEVMTVGIDDSITDVVVVMIGEEVITSELVVVVEEDVVAGAVFASLVWILVSSSSSEDSASSKKTFWASIPLTSPSRATRSSGLVSSSVSISAMVG